MRWEPSYTDCFVARFHRAPRNDVYPYSKPYVIASRRKAVKQPVQQTCNPVQHGKAITRFHKKNVLSGSNDLPRPGHQPG